MALSNRFQCPRGTRAALVTLAAASGVKPGELYFLTDENRVLVGLSTTTYGDLDGETVNLATEVTTDAPAVGTPTTGVRLFAATRANRRLPGYISPTGRSERLQPFLGSNEIMLVDVPAGGTLYNTLGTAMAADVGTATTPNITTTNLLTMQPRRVLAVAATVNLMMEAKASAPWCSRRLVGGGFHFTTRFGLETVLPATGRLFVGLTDSTTALTSADQLGTVTNSIGINKQSAGTTLTLLLANTPASQNQSIVLTNTGAVGWNVAGTMFQLEIFCKPNDTGFGYRVTRWVPGSTPNTSAPVVAIDDGFVSTGQLPAIDTLFVPHIWAQNVAATATSFAFIQMYKESD
jgi:hypothetical protein